MGLFTFCIYAQLTPNYSPTGLLLLPKKKNKPSTVKPKCTDTEGISTEIPSSCRMIGGQRAGYGEVQPQQLVATALAHKLFRPGSKTRGTNDGARGRKTA